MSTQPADKVTIADIIIHGVQTALRTAVITSFLCFLLGIGVTLAGNLRLLHLGASQSGYAYQTLIEPKKNSKGYKETWIGYKQHIDVACGQIPVSCVLTSASVHDSQVAIPLMTMTGARVTYLYDLMDAAYDADAIHDHSRALGHAPIIDRNFRAQHEVKAEWEREVDKMKLIHMPDADDVIYDFRTMVERVNARLTDEFGARFLRVRGAIKVKCHLMFGIVALAADQIIRVASFRPAQA